MTTTRGILSLGAMIGAFCVWAVPALAAPPANTAAPTITGTARVGETLTAQNGTWTNSPTAFQYQWQRCNASGAACANVAGATQKTYLLTPADSGRTMRVRVTGINADGAVNRALCADGRRDAERGSAEHGTADDRRRARGRPGADRRGRDVDEHADVVCVPVAALRHRRDLVRRRRRRDRQDVRRACGRRRLPASGRGDRAQRKRRRLGPVEPLGDRRPVGADHECPSERDADLGALPRRPRVRPVPDLRRLAAEPDDSRDGLAAREGVADAALHDADRAEPVRRLHPQLGPAVRFRGKGRYTVTIAVRDTSGRTSAPVRKTFIRR